MAEAISRHLLDNRIRVASAGLAAKSVHPYTRQVLKEIGIDWQHAQSKTMQQTDVSQYDLVISVCDVDACVAVPQARRHLNWNLEDPTASDSLEKFREIRDQIRARIERELLPFVNGNAG